MAVVLLDVIMETDAAGLELVEFIRNELKNETVRIILRTGQPGQAPERRVIVDYDINDYKAKTELTADKLFTALTAALRSYQQLQRMVETRRGLEIIIEAAVDAVRFQVDAAAGRGRADPDRVAAQRRLRRHPGAARSAERARDLLGAGRLRLLQPLHRDRRSREIIDNDLRKLVEEAFARRQHEFSPRRSVLYIKTGAAARSWSCWKRRASSPTPTGRWSRCSAAGSRSPSTTSSSTSSCRRRTRAWRSASRERTQDLTAANRRLAAQWARLRQANTFKSEILGTVAHDLKNPLGVILGRTEILKEMIAGAGALDDNMQAQIAHIRNAANRLTEMVDDLVADAMADALDITIRREPVDLAGLVQEVAEANRPLAARKEQTITVVRPARPHGDVRCRPHARGDRQPRQQRHQVQPDRRRHRPLGGRGRRTV